MDRTLWLALLFNHLLVIDCRSGQDLCLTQPNRIIWRKIGQAAVLQCTISPHCPTRNVDYEWFAFKENVHFRLNLNNKDKYSLDGASLHIKSLNVNDSGIYHCAASSKRVSGCCAQHVGPGETLVVKDKIKTMVRHILLLVSFVLLAIYSLALLTFILLKKSGRSMSLCRKTSKAPQVNTSSKKKQFRDVLQEMHRKRNLGKSKKAASGNHSRAEAAHNNFDDDGIYQNM